MVLVIQGGSDDHVPWSSDGIENTQTPKIELHLEDELHGLNTIKMMGLYS